MRIPEYRLRKAYSYEISIQNSITLPAGSFVKPIQIQYVPEHVRDLFDAHLVDFKTHVFCYTRLGFYVLPKRILEEV